MGKALPHKLEHLKSFLQRPWAERNAPVIPALGRCRQGSLGLPDRLLLWNQWAPGLVTHPVSRNKVETKENADINLQPLPAHTGIWTCSTMHTHTQDYVHALQHTHTWLCTHSTVYTHTRRICTHSTTHTQEYVYTLHHTQDCVHTLHTHKDMGRLTIEVLKCKFLGPGKRTHSVVKSTDYSCRGWEFDSQHTHGGS